MGEKLERLVAKITAGLRQQVVQLSHKLSAKRQGDVTLRDLTIEALQGLPVKYSAN